jgi:hypothetical protein
MGDAELEVSGPQGFVESKISEFLESQSRSPFLGKAIGDHVARQPAVAERRPSGKQTSVAQFFRKVAPKTDIDRVLIAGYFLEHFRNTEKFTAAEVRDTIREAKIPPPSNPSDAVAKNIKKGFMMPAGDKDGKLSYVLTSDGEENVKESLNE